MWREYIRGVTKAHSFSPPATIEQIESLESALKVSLPAVLCSLLLECNGVKDEYQCDLIWPVERIIADNTLFRTFEDFKELYMPFDHLLFFSDAGNGDLFGYAITGGSIHSTNIFCWDHEDDSRRWKASSVKDFIKRWSSGEIAV